MTRHVVILVVLLGVLIGQITPQNTRTSQNDPLYQRGFQLIQDALQNFQSQRITWPNKPASWPTLPSSTTEPPEEESTTPEPTTTEPPVTETTRTTRGGLLFHITLPSQSPQSSESPELHRQLVDTLRSQIQISNPDVTLDWVRPTSDLCHAEQDSRFRATDGKTLHWPETKIGDSAVSLEPCYDVNLQPLRRPCLQDLTFGAQWGDPEGACSEAGSSSATAALLNVSHQVVTAENAGEVTRMLAEAMGHADTPRAVDVLLVADAFTKLSNAAQGLSASNMPHLATLLDGVLRSSNAPRSEDHGNKDAEATRVILSSLDKILSGMSLDDAKEGVASAHTSQTALMVADLARSGLRGVVAIPGEDSAFSGVESWNPESDQQAEVSAKLLGDLDGGRASFVFIGNTRTFPSQDSKVVVNSRVVGVTVTSWKDNEIELQLRPLHEPGPGQERHCAYWDLELGEWSTQGCRLVRHDPLTGRDVCRCTHLTHFGEILGVRTQSVVLDVISLVGCGLSLLGLFGIALTAAFFKQWRSKLGNKLLLHLSGAIALTMIAFLGIALGGASGGTGDPGCIILGVLMHYSVLAAFCWMLVSALLQLLRFVFITKTRPPHFLLKGVIFSWGAPLIPIIGLMIAGPVSSYSAPNLNDGTTPFCYPRGLGLILGVTVPISLTVLANLIAFSLIVYSVGCGRNKKLLGNVSGICERQMAIRQLKMSILLFFLLGLTWVFGLFAFISPDLEYWRLFCSYAFCITATLQGLVMFLFFVLWERKSRALWLATLPGTVRPRGTFSESTSVTSPSTESTSGHMSRHQDEVAPLRQRYDRN